MYVNAIYAQMAGSDPTHDQVDGILDSGNNKHHCFTDLVFFPEGVTYITLRITGIHGDRDVRVGKGVAQFYTTCTDGSRANWSFADSLYNPQSPVTLLCLDRFHHFPNGQRTGHHVDLLNTSLHLSSGRTCLFTLHPVSKLNIIGVYPRALDEPAVTQLFKRTQLRDLSTRAALARLGQPLEEYFNMTLKHDMVDGISHLSPASSGRHARRTDGWYAGKMTLRNIPQVHARNPTHPGSDIYTDIGGPVPVPTRDGYKYYVIYKDSYTQHLRGYLMKTKEALLNTFRMYIADMQAFFNSPHGALQPPLIDESITSPPKNSTTRKIPNL